MKIPLSKRLRLCCDYITPGDRVADVGTDHGYLGLWLLQQGIAESIIASDIVPGPLSAAKNNAEKYGFEEQMSFYLSDGVQNIPRDFDTLVCAGMGGDTMISILEHGPWLRDARYKLVLQCQSKTPMLRRYLSEQGYRILQENLVRDGKFIYSAMEVRYEPGEVLTPGQCYFPPALLASGSELLGEYCGRLLEGLRQAAAHRQDPELKKVLEELDNVFSRIKEADHGNCQ